jgi:hypothetical protein
MLKMLLLVVAGLAAGFAVATWMQPGRELPQTQGSVAAVRAAASGVERYADSQAPRLAMLESALQTEIEQRAVLEARVLDLADELEELRVARLPARGDGPSGVPAEDSAVGGGRARFLRGAADSREGLARRQVDLLIAAGFPPDRAEWINQRASELRMQALLAQYDATREGRPFSPANALTGDQTLRTDLGDTDYERYLRALERPTSVGVRNVLASSPAERAGLKAGDEVLAYDGKRVFDMRELNSLTLQGTPGESVVVEVLRDGQRTQLVMPRGPIGIFGGGFRGGP